VSRVLAVLVTYRRPAELRRMLEVVAASDRVPDRLVVVDNDPTPAARAEVERFSGSMDYVAAPENLGPAGGIALGMSRALEDAAPEDWILLLDDDDPPHDGLSLGTLVAFGERMSRDDPRTGGIGLVGARFDPRRGEMVRVPDDELAGPVPLDYLGGNQFPLYRVDAVRRIGRFREDLFFGFEELEYGLRMRRAGFSLYADGDEWRSWRATWGRLGIAARPRTGLGEPSWRRYYGLRNLIAILRSNGSTRGALRVTFVLGVAKPLTNLLRRPRRADAHLSLGWRAARDGWTDRMGRTVEPDLPRPVASVVGSMGVVGT
jgi:glycosyltransferase involved in cell wall biosynthesis